MVTDKRKLQGMVRHGFIEWSDARERHWTGATVRRRWVAPGPKLASWYETFTYRGREYRLQYFDGCFHPFVVEVGKPQPSFV